MKPFLQLSSTLKQRCAHLGLLMCMGLASAITGCGGSSSSTAPAPAPPPAPPAPTLVQMGGGLQGIPLSLSANVSTFSGGTLHADGVGTSARFNMPYDVTSDGTNLYIADTGNSTIRQVVLATGVVTTLAGNPGVKGSTDGIGSAALFNIPQGITTDGTYVYVTDVKYNTIRRITIATGMTTTIAGSPALGLSSIDGVGTAASFNTPNGITTDGSSLYVTEAGNAGVRRINLSTLQVTTLSRTFSSGTLGITYLAGNVYVACGDGTIVRVATSSGVTSIIAGTANSFGNTDGVGAIARFSVPQGISNDGANLFVSDTGNLNIRQINVATGNVTTIAGGGTRGNADGIGLAATFSDPRGMAVVHGRIYIADESLNVIRQLDLSSNAVTTAFNHIGVDGIASSSLYNWPTAITTDGHFLYVADSKNQLIRKVAIAYPGSIGVLDGTSVTLAGMTGQTGVNDGPGLSATFNSPMAITTDGTYVFVADMLNHTVRKIVISTGVVSTLAGTAGVVGSADGVGAAASFRFLNAITTDGIYVYVADSNAIRKILIANGTVTTIAGTSGTAGKLDGVGIAAAFTSPYGLTTDGSNLYVADTLNHAIRKIDLSTNTVTTIAGSLGVQGSVNGVGTATLFRAPKGITTDGTVLYISDTGNQIVRQLVLSTGVVTTIAGTSETVGFVNGVGGAALFTQPWGITSDGVSLYVNDSYNNDIRQIK